MASYRVLHNLDIGARFSLGFADVDSTTTALTPPGASSPGAPSSLTAMAQASSRPLNVTLRLPNNQVLLRQWVSGMESEGLA